HPNVLWIEVGRSFQVFGALLPPALSPRNEAGQLRNGGVVRQTTLADGELRQRCFVIAVAMVGNPCRGQMSFAAVRHERSCFLQSLPGLRNSMRRAISAAQIKRDARSRQ